MRGELSFSLFGATGAGLVVERVVPLFLINEDTIILSLFFFLNVAVNS